MAIGRRLRDATRSHPRRATALLSLVGYALVAAAFAPGLPFPTIGRGTVILLGDAIAVVNTFALTSILAGVYFIRQEDVRRHRAAMLTGFALILVFLSLYLVKVGGGFEKSIRASGLVYWTYLVMLAVHILLSALAVPAVLHAVVLGLTHTPEELRDTVHPRVGRIAVAAWSLSLFLGIVTYLLLNHVYGWEPLHAALPAVAGARLRFVELPGGDRR